MYRLPGVCGFRPIKILLQQFIEAVFYGLPFLIQEMLELAFVRDPFGIKELLEIGAHLVGCC